MARKPNQAAEMIDPTTAAHDSEISSNAAALAHFQVAHSVAVTNLASELGYDGDLSIGSIEDRIRFHQRRTVESMLEVGKGLLMLKEQVGHGEFLPRLALLGIGEDTAGRFMRASAKTAKSRNLRNLSEQVASISGFMELVLVDDEDTLKAISELDDIDRMPASELRRLVRGMKDSQAKDEKLIATKNKLIDKLKNKFEDSTPEELLAHKARPLYDLIASAQVLATKLSIAVGKVLEEEDGLLKAEAYNALTLATQYMLRAADENYMPLDMEAIGLDVTDFETKALGLAALDADEEA